jgi:hypothetical protein
MHCLFGFFSRVPIEALLENFGCSCCCFSWQHTIVGMQQPSRGRASHSGSALQKYHGKTLLCMHGHGFGSSSPHRPASKVLYHKNILGGCMVNTARKPYLYEHLRRLRRQILEIDDVTTGASLSTGMASTTESITPLNPKIFAATWSQTLLRLFVITGPSMHCWVFYQHALLSWWRVGADERGWQSSEVELGWWHKLGSTHTCIHILG